MTAPSTSPAQPVRPPARTDRDEPAFEQTLAAARAGDERAFAALWERFNPMLVRYLRVVARAHAEDLASETWLQVIRGLREFTGDDGAFKGWLFTIARNRVTDWRRYEARRPAASFDPDVDDAASADDTEQAVIDRLGTDDALRLIAALPPDHAEIIMLRVVAGLDVAAVATLVGKSAGSVRVTSHRALHRLRTLVESSNGGVTR